MTSPTSSQNSCVIMESKRTENLPLHHGISIEPKAYHLQSVASCPGAHKFEESRPI